MIYDLLIVGGGPAGLSAACHAKKEGLSVLILEQGEFANTVFDYQKKKHVMAEPGVIPLRSGLPFEAGFREEVLRTWHEAARKLQIPINRPELVEEVAKKDTLFQIRSNKATYQARHVILAIGIQGNPNRLGKPGEELPHVTYKMPDPFIYKDLDVILVGAGDAAIEGALALCERNRVCCVINRSTAVYRLKESLLKEKLSFLEGTTPMRLDYIARAIPLLAEVQKQHLRELLLQTTVHQVPPWQNVFKENDFTDSLYMILEGEVGITFAQRPGAFPLLFKRGEFFGEVSLLSGRRRSGTVTTVTPSTLLEVPRKAVLRLMASEPSVKRLLNETFIARA